MCRILCRRIGLFQLSFVLSCLVSRILGAINVTIDDTSSLITYTPTGSWREGSNCLDRLTVPDALLAFNGSWHTTASDPSTVRPAVQIPFRGTAVYAFFIIANQGSEASLVNTTFFVDGHVAGNYVHVPSPSSTSKVEYNVPVFAMENLPNTQHMLFMESNEHNNSSMMMFDYLLYTSEEAIKTNPLVPRDPQATVKPSAKKNATATASPAGNGVAASPKSTAVRAPSSANSPAASRTGTSTSPSATRKQGGGAGGKSGGSSTPIGAIVGGVVGGVAAVGAAIGGFLFWRRRKRMRNSEGDIIKNVGNDRAALDRRQGSAPVSILTSPADADMVERRANVVQPFVMNDAPPSASNYAPAYSTSSGVGGERHFSPAASTPAVASASPQPSSKAARTRFVAMNADESSHMPQNSASGSGHPEEVKTEIASLWNEINRLRQLVPGGALSTGNEEPPPSYEAEFLPQERDRLLTARDTLLRKTPR